MTEVDVKKLHSTTDARVWSQEFMKVVDGGAVVDEGLMTSWFANAIERARPGSATPPRPDLLLRSRGERRDDATGG